MRIAQSYQGYAILYQICNMTIYTMIMSFDPEGHGHIFPHGLCAFQHNQVGSALHSDIDHWP